MNPVIEQIYATKKVEDSEGRSENLFPCAVPKEEGLVLYRLIQRTGAENTLEVGLGYGLSTLFMCQAHKDKGSGHHVAIDPWERNLWKSIGLLNTQRAGLDGILEFHEAPSQQVLPELLRQGRHFDLVFIDGVHLFDYTLVEFFYADKLLNVGGHLVLDDLWLPSVRKVLAFILRNRSYRMTREFQGIPFPIWRRAARLAQVFVRAPWEFHSARFWLFQARFNYCVLEKLAEEDWQTLYKKWTHYRSF